jgi:hypothetical protein
MHPVVALAAAGIAKVAFMGWAGGVAADPLAEDARKEFLDRAETVLKKLAILEQLPLPEDLKSLREDLELLHSRLDMGWEKTYEVAAAKRIMNFLVWERTKGATFGIGRVLYNVGDAFGGYLDKKRDQVLDAVFGPKRPDPDAHR